MPPRRLAYTFGILFFLHSPLALAQTGEISGTLTDQNGALVPGAQIVVMETSTGTRRTLVTNAVGNYSASSLLPGPYTVDVSHEGFKQVSRSGIELQVDQQRRLDFALLIGSASEQITVQSDVPVLNTETRS